MAVWSTTSKMSLFIDKRMDAEFYQPAYQRFENTVRSIKPFVFLHQLGDFVIGPFGSAFDTNNYEINSAYRYIRGRDVKPFVLLDDDNRYIPETDFLRLHRYHVKNDDIFISVVGTLGNAAICPTPDIKAIFSCKSTIFRHRNIDAYYLLAYLNSSYGYNSMIRRQRGAVQGGLNKEDLATVPVPRFGKDVEKAIGDIVRKAFEARNQAQSFYFSAQSLLSSALKENELKFDQPLSYTTRFSDVMREGRADAEFFQVPFMQMQKHLDRIECVPLSSLVDLVKGIEVGSNAYAENGKLFMRVSNLTELGMKTNASDKHISEGLYQLLSGAFQPKPGELLLTKDGTPGVCWVVDRPIECIVSGAIVRLLPKKSDVPPEYLALAINSTLCRMQVEQHVSGALILHLKLPLVKKLRIPLCNKETMQKIARLVKEAKKQQYKSESFLAAAKSRVEELIETEAKRRA